MEDEGSGRLDEIERSLMEAGGSDDEGVRSPLGDLILAVILTLFSLVICRAGPRENGRGERGSWGIVGMGFRRSRRRYGIEYIGLDWEDWPSL
jgi:hypothetical protein